MSNFTIFKVLSYFLAIIFISANISLAQWHSDTRLTNDSAFSATTFNSARGLAVDGNVLHTIWFDERDGNREIYYKRSGDGGIIWSPDTRITNNSAVSQFPSLSVSGPMVHVMWEDCRDGNSEIYYKQSTDAGITWGGEIRLTVNTAASLSPSSAVSGSDVHVVWFDYRDGNNEIYYKRSTDGGASWSFDTRLTVNSAASLYPSVSVSGSNLHVVWEDCRDGANGEIYYKRSTDRGASWGPDTRLTFNSSKSLSPSVAVSGSDVHIVWFDERDGNDEIYHKHSSNGGVNWAADKRITNNFSVSSYPSLSVSGSNVHVSWIDERDGNTEVYYNRSTNGGASWGSDLRLTNNISRSTDPYILASGSAVHIVWTDARDAGNPYNGNYEIYYKQNPAGNPEPLDLNISMIVEGLYNIASHKMSMTDTIRAYLRSTVAPFDFIDSARSLIDPVTFTGNFTFGNTPVGLYYIVIKHRNGLETWSNNASRTVKNNSTSSYDFTNALSQAFGNNMKQVDISPVRFAVFSGDPNQDGSINILDIIAVFNSALNFSSGYVSSDMNGDGIVNLTDLLITYNNSVNFVAKITP